MAHVFRRPSSVYFRKRKKFVLPVGGGGGGTPWCNGIVGLVLAGGTTSVTADLGIRLETPSGGVRGDVPGSIEEASKNLYDSRAGGEYYAISSPINLPARVELNLLNRADSTGLLSLQSNTVSDQASESEAARVQRQDNLWSVELLVARGSDFLGVTEVTPLQKQDTSGTIESATLSRSDYGPAAEEIAKTSFDRQGSVEAVSSGFVDSSG